MPHSMLTAWLGAVCTHVVIIIYQSVKALGSHVRVSTNKIWKSETFFFFGWFLLEWVDLNDELTTRIYYTRKTINKMHLNFTSSLCLYTFCLSCVVEHWSESWSLLHLLALTSSDKYWIILLLLLLDGKLARVALWTSWAQILLKGMTFRCFWRSNDSAFNIGAL